MTADKHKNSNYNKVKYLTRGPTNFLPKQSFMKDFALPQTPRPRLHSLKGLILTVLFTVSLIATLTQHSIEVIEIPLSVHDRTLTTTIEVEQTQQQMKVDIETEHLKICCKQENSIFQKVYYFLFNPFFRIQDYSCKKTTADGFVEESAKFDKLGYLKLEFIQEQFPECHSGVLGLNQNSKFLKLLPVNLESFSIYRNPGEYERYTLRFGQDLSAVKEFQFFETIAAPKWSVQPKTSMYNQVVQQKYPIELSTTVNRLELPNQYFEFVKNQLIKGYECAYIDHDLFCPCEIGSSSSFPSFWFQMQNGFKLQIPPNRYMIQDSEICRVMIRSIERSVIRSNILLFSGLTIKFDPVNTRLGFLHDLTDSDNHGKIKLPLQLILNCLVILLLCVFLALVLIEIIKRVSGLAECREETFRVDTREQKYERDYDE